MISLKVSYKQIPVFVYVLLLCPIAKVTSDTGPSVGQMLKNSVTEKEGSNREDTYSTVPQRSVAKDAISSSEFDSDNTFSQRVDLSTDGSTVRHGHTHVPGQGQEFNVGGSTISQGQEFGTGGTTYRQGQELNIDGSTVSTGQELHRQTTRVGQSGIVHTFESGITGQNTPDPVRNSRSPHTRHPNQGNYQIDEDTTRSLQEQSSGMDDLTREPNYQSLGSEGVTRDQNYRTHQQNGGLNREPSNYGSTRYGGSTRQQTGHMEQRDTLTRDPRSRSDRLTRDPNYHSSITDGHQTRDQMDQTMTSRDYPYHTTESTSSRRSATPNSRIHTTADQEYIGPVQTDASARTMTLHTTVPQATQIEVTTDDTLEKDITDDVERDDVTAGMTSDAVSDVDLRLLTTLGNVVVKEGATDLMAIVKALQTQFKESHTSEVRTRSVLYQIQEKQAAQDVDLAVLKNQISQVQKQQEEDHKELESLKTMVSDNSWALVDLKSSHNQFRTDVHTLKKFQSEQNDTLRDVEEMVDRTDMLHRNYRSSIAQLQQDVYQIKNTMHRDRVLIGKIKQVLGDTISSRTQNTNSTRQNTTNGYPNRIPAVAGQDSTESSGEDITASRLEERDNTVGHQLVHIIEHGQQMKQEMDGLQGKFLTYDADFSRMYAMFYNLSLQVSTLENRVLAQQQRRYESEVGDLQRMLANFTQHAFHMEQMTMTSQSQANISAQNQRQIDHISVLLENHKNRIRSMEELLLEQRNMRQLTHNALSSHINQVNESVQAQRSRLNDHHNLATESFSETEDNLTHLGGKLQRLDNRLAHVEVRVLNTTLQHCQKGNTDLVQDMKLSTFSEDLDKNSRTTNENMGKIARIDRGMSRFYQDIQSQGKTMNEVMDQVANLMNVVPVIQNLQHEVGNLVQQLPIDCEIPLMVQKQRNGVYLIKPEMSSSSARTYCEADDNTYWTYIQQRNNGTERFGRTWEEYKKGFGDPDKEFWIGNDNLHFLTTQNDYLLHLDMWDINGNYWVAEYNFFKVDEESTNYRLHIDGYSGNATDALKYSNFMPFSTIDQDNDASSTHCAKFYTAGWWYKHCHYSNLNGRYTVGIVWFSQDMDEWLQMRRTVMKIRPIHLSANVTTTAYN